MRPQPLFVELIGPAGAGKSTLFKGLGRLDSVLAHPSFGVRQYEYLPQFFLFGLVSLPSLLRQLVNDRPYSWEETKKLIYLRGGRGFLQLPNAKEQSIVLLDQGPIFELARLREFGPEVLKPERIPRWWDDCLDRWSEILDLAVILDAQEEILLRRIHDRDVWHLAKEMPLEVAHDFLRRYRTAYRELTEQIQARGRLTVVRIDTGLNSARETLDLAIGALDERCRQDGLRRPAAEH